MAEAQNLNMVGGHFIWVWADTSSTTEFFEAYNMPLVDDPIEKLKLPVELPINPVLTQRKSHVVEPPKPANKPPAPDQGSVRYHLDDFLERKMDFEDLNPNREANKQRARQRNRNKSKENPSRDGSRVRNQPPPERYIIGLNSDAVPDLSNEFGPLIKRNQEAVELLDKRSSEESAEHFFISNLNTDDHVQFAIDSTLPVNENGADGESDTESEAKPKRRISLKDFNANEKANYTANHVLFHHFKDFPVGFLALRPIRMMVDRHFIRAAVRLLASTWAKVELEARENAVRAIQRTKSKLNRWGQEMPRGSRKQRRKRQSAHQVNSKSNLPLAKSDLVPTSSNKFPINITMQTTSEEKENDDPTTRANNQNMLSGLNDGQHDNSGETNLRIRSHKQFINRNPSSQEESNNETIYEKNGSRSSVIDVKEGVGSDERLATKLRRRDASSVGKRHGTWWAQEQEWLSRDSDIRYLKGAPHYRGGCYGRPDDEDVWNAKYFAR